MSAPQGASLQMWCLVTHFGVGTSNRWLQPTYFDDDFDAFASAEVKLPKALCAASPAARCAVERTADGMTFDAGEQGVCGLRVGSTRGRTTRFLYGNDLDVDSLDHGESAYADGREQQTGLLRQFTIYGKQSFVTVWDWWIRREATRLPLALSAYDLLDEHVLPSETYGGLLVSVLLDRPALIQEAAVRQNITHIFWFYKFPEVPMHTVAHGANAGERQHGSWLPSLRYAFFFGQQEFSQTGVFDFRQMMDYREVTHLVIWGCDIPQASLTAAASFPNLRSLELSECCGFSIVTDLVKACPGLREVHLRDPRDRIQDPDAFLCLPNLATYKTLNCPLPPPQSLARHEAVRKPSWLVGGFACPATEQHEGNLADVIAASAPNLREWELRGGGRLREPEPLDLSPLSFLETFVTCFADAVTHLMMPHCAVLSTLALENCTSLQVVDFTGATTSLRTLTLGSVPALHALVGLDDANSLEAVQLSHAPVLEALHLPGGDALRTVTVSCCPALHVLTGLSLRARGEKLVESCQLRCCPALTEVDIRGCQHAVISACHALTTFTGDPPMAATSCTANTRTPLQDETRPIAAAREAVSALLTLELWCCDALCCVDLCRMPKAWSVRLSRCGGLRRIVADSHTPMPLRLADLYVKACNNLESMELVRCSRLGALHVQACPKLARAELCVAERSRALWTLTVIACPEINTKLLRVQEGGVVHVD